MSSWHRGADLQDAVASRAAGRYYEDLLANAIHADFWEGGEAHVDREVEVCDGRYRVDFLVEIRGLRFSIEVDGWEYHHSRKALTDATYARMREIRATGIIPIHFTAREVQAHASRCVAELRRLVRVILAERESA